ncbi:p21-activated protein kinase [Reticulomyxa filosa]|uniref:p21-activated protein kinase n=1 Tax=Reticulomyxa filosa TaxID=46433 RepID=X6P8Q4_RETFI|nr:p21-activated protein kinase [Reticulomyxa filosa]|eukprot:ETO34493.1 p21-activated protein kinase [Reticulomyxa filosa]
MRLHNEKWKRKRKMMVGKGMRRMTFDKWFSKNNDSTTPQELKHHYSPLSVMNENETETETETENETKSNAPFRFNTITLATDDSHKIKENATDITHEFTIVLIGGSRTGKSSIAKRFVADRFSFKYKRSVELKEYQHKCTVPIELQEKIFADTNMDMEGLFDDPIPTHPTDISIDRGCRSPNRPQNVDNNNNDDDGDKEREAKHVGPLFSFADFEYRDDDDDNVQVELESSPAPAEAIPQSQLTKDPIGSQKKHIRVSKMDLNVNLHIIDLGFHAIGDDTFFEKVDALVLVCDVTDTSSLEYLLFKYQDFLSKMPLIRKRRTSSVASEPLLNGSDPPFIPVIVVANKCDQKQQRVIYHQDIQNFVQTNIQPIVDSQWQGYYWNANANVNANTNANGNGNSPHDAVEELDDLSSVGTPPSYAMTPQSQSQNHLIATTPLGHPLHSHVIALDTVGTLGSSNNHNKSDYNAALSPQTPLSTVGVRKQVDETLWNPPSVNVLFTQNDTTWSDEDNDNDNNNNNNNNNNSNNNNNNNNNNNTSHNRRTKDRGDETRSRDTRKRHCSANDTAKRIANENGDVSDVASDDSGHISLKKIKLMSPAHEPTDFENDNDDYKLVEDDANVDDIYADSTQVSIVECSAATGKNVQKVFEKCIHKVCSRKYFLFTYIRVFHL